MLNPHVGEQYDRLAFVGIVRHQGAGKPRIGLWQCACGGRVEAAITRVVNGYTRSCGCLARERGSLVNRTHGGKGTREYRQWIGAKNRCFNRNCKDFHRYGGRGISMCDEWRHSFGRFIADMGPCPAGLTLDRKLVDGDYTPENCRWATPKEQANNRRNTIVTALGRISEVAANLGISHGAAYMRHKRRSLHV